MTEAQISLKGFNDKELELVLTALTLHTIQAKLTKEEFNIILAIMAKSEARLRSRNAFVRSLIPAAQVAAAPMEIWWAANSFFNLGSAAFALAGVFLGLTAVIGGSYFYFDYKNTQKKVKERIDFCKLAELRLAVYGELFARKGITSHAGDISILEHSRAKNYSEVKTRLAAIGVGVMAIGTLFASYYIGATSILGALGAAAVAASMVGPIGIAIACTFAVLAGIYLGYRYYQAKKGLQDIKILEHKLNIKLSYKKAEYAGVNSSHAAISVADDSMSPVVINDISVPQDRLANTPLDSSSSIISRTFFGEEEATKPETSTPKSEPGRRFSKFKRRISLFSDRINLARSRHYSQASTNSEPDKRTWARLKNLD